jgi:hypothetical protein
LEHSWLLKLSFRGINGSGGAFLDVTNLMGKVASESVRRFGRNSHGRRRLNGETRMLVTEQDAVIDQWRPMIRLRRESRPFATGSVWFPQPAIAGNVRAQRCDAPTGGGERVVLSMRLSPERLCNDR